MLNLMCFLTMSQFLWFLRRFSRSVGGCVLSTDGPRKDHRLTVQVSFLRRFIRVAAVCSSQRGDNYCNAGRPESVAMAIPQSARQRKTFGRHEWYGVSARKRNDEPAGSGARAAVCGFPSRGSLSVCRFLKFRLKSCVQRLAGL